MKNRVTYDGYAQPMFSEHLEALRPKNKPSRETIAAAGKFATVSNSQLGYLKLSMEQARLNGRKPKIPILELPETTAVV